MEHPSGTQKIWQASGDVGDPADSHRRLNLTDLERALRLREPAALLVSPRILRRVIRQRCRLPAWGLKLPHRKSFVIARDDLLAIVEKEEIGLRLEDRLPEKLILLPQPSPEQFDETPAEELLVRWWRLLFHARVHVALEERIAAGRLTAAELRRRIHQIGPMAFDEIRTVLKHEDFLLPPRDDRTVYVEFAAVYLELKYFAPSLVSRYFPGLDGAAAVDAILIQDLDAAELYLSSRPSGAPDPTDQPAPKGLEEWTAPEDREDDGPLPPPRASERRFRKWMARAGRAAAAGNLVRAAIRSEVAARAGSGSNSLLAREAAKAHLEQLARRLEAALDLAPDRSSPWRKALEALAEHAARGFWTVEGRLLYDLQKACVDHERKIHTVDLVEWALSLGKRPIKRLLPGQGHVLMAKHLRAAMRRVSTVRVSMEQRADLSALIREGMDRVEERIRRRFRPQITSVLEEVGMEPRNLPERVARKKLIEEMLDRVVDRGYLTMGDFRDALSRNNLKLPDLSRPADVVRGDHLLRADARLSIVLDGIYRRGEFYLRWMQKLSSLAFGTWPGRLVMRYAAIPFGGAFLVLAFFQHLVEQKFFQQFVARWVEHPELPVQTFGNVLILGLFLMALINIGPFRRGLGRLLRAVYHVARAVLVDLPRWFIGRHWVQRILHSRPFVLAFRFVLKPLVVTAVVWWLLPLEGAGPRASILPVSAIFVTVNLLLNSRLGRHVEEALVDWAIQAWHRFGLRFVTMLFAAVMDFFRAALRTLERLLYAVDEWLRFRSGQSQFTLASKAVLGAAWFAVTYVVRFAVNLLIEPQINPIKHFPVVTVSHKLLLPTIPIFKTVLVELTVEPAMAWTIATAVITSIPGVFGFLVWELKENWRLYEANRPKNLRRVIVGQHGETMPRMLRLGLHSGTLPKRYGKLRRADRRARLKGNWKPVRKQLHALRHDERAIRHFIEREFLELFRECASWRESPIRLERIRLGPSVIQIAVGCPSISESWMWIALEVRGDWLVAGITRSGWADRLPPEEREILSAALVGLYKASGVELARQQIEAELSPPAYDIVPRGLLVWTDAGFETEFLYDLRHEGRISPKPVRGVDARRVPSLARSKLVFGDLPMSWQCWWEFWEHRAPSSPAASIRLLPPSP